MAEQRTLIKGEGSLELEAAVTPGQPHGMAAVICHPWGRIGGCMDDHVVMTVREALVQRGFTVCRFNFRGVGMSTGGASFTASSEQKDLEAVCEYLASGSNIGGKPCAPAARRIVLVGYSYGSMVATACIDRIPLACGACAISYPFDYGWALALWNAGDMWRRFIASSKPRLMVGGDRDGFCSRNRFERESSGLVSAGGERQMFEDVDHFWQGGAQRRAMATLVGDWAERTCKN